MKNISAIFFSFTLMLISPSLMAFGMFGGSQGSLEAQRANPDLPNQLTFWMELWVDPVSAGINNVDYQLAYNSSKWVFHSEFSGLLCDYSTNGSCPQINVTYGEKLLSELSYSDVTAGSPLPGSDYSLTNDSQSGLIHLNYQMKDSLPGSTRDQNFLRLVFESVQSINPTQTTINIHGPNDNPGNSGYDFLNISLSCNSECGSEKPVSYITVTSVPIPNAIYLFISSLIMFSVTSLRRISP